VSLAPVTRAVDTIRSTVAGGNGFWPRSPRRARMAPVRVVSLLLKRFLFPVCRSAVQKLSGVRCGLPESGNF
jgi:hypothetical protein